MLIDYKVLAKIVNAASICKNDTICEAGTGKGILTAELCKHARHVISYEVDKELFKKAQAELQFQNLKLVNADLFRTKGEQQKQEHFDIFVSNLPYSRSRDAFEWLATQKFARAIVMVQKEFAEKITAKPGDKNYRAISVLSAHCFKIDRLFIVGRQSFQPPPMVESAVIKLTPINTVTSDIIKNLNLLFSKRNKKASAVARKISPNLDLGSNNNNNNNNDNNNKRIDQLEADVLVKIAAGMQQNVLRSI